MKLVINKTQLSASYSTFLKQAGYNFITDKRSGKTSYMRSLARGNYPRFHLYVKEDDNGILLDLHLDHKQTSYDGYHMHNAEYDGDLVVGEIARLAGLAGQEPYVQPEKPMPEAYMPKLRKAEPLRFTGKKLVMGHGSLEEFTANPPQKKKKKWWQIFG